MSIFGISQEIFKEENIFSFFIFSKWEGYKFIENIMLLNLFLSILMRNYQKNDEIILFDKEENKKNELQHLDSSMNQLENERLFVKIL